MTKKTVQPANENKLIQLLKERSAFQSPLLKKGIGDDAAVIRPRGAKEFWLITTDMLVENIDFRREWMKPRQLGQKSLAVNLSDLAAMGARPRFFTVSLAIPSDVSEHWILEFHDGLAQIGNQLNVHLIGGDLSREDRHIVISISAIGESLNRRVIYRSGGKAGDLLYVTGELGRSASGLKLLLSGKSHTRSLSQRSAMKAHRLPQPRCEVGIWLAQTGMASCMIDLSDGLSMDLPRLCGASGVGAEIYSPQIPVFPESARWDCNPLALALNGGEDYELLFAVPASKRRLLENSYPASFPRLTTIGELTGDAGKLWITGPDESRRPLKELGYDHFTDHPV